MLTGGSVATEPKVRFGERACRRERFCRTALDPGRLPLPLDDPGIGRSVLYNAGGYAPQSVVRVGQD
jgi:hypothetical protein